MGLYFCKAYNKILSNQQSMNNFASLLLPAVIGLVSGVGHGITSHYLDLPFSLTEQLFPTLTSQNSLYE